MQEFKSSLGNIDHISENKRGGWDDPGLRKLRKEDYLKFKASLGYTGDLISKPTK